MSGTEQKRMDTRKRAGRPERKGPSRRRAGTGRFPKKQPASGPIPGEEHTFQRLPEGFDPSFGILGKESLPARREPSDKRSAPRKAPKSFVRAKTRRVIIREASRPKRSIPRPAPSAEGIPTHEFIIQVGALAASPLYGKGRITAIEENTLTVAFKDAVKTYRLPDAIIDGSLEIL